MPKQIFPFSWFFSLINDLSLTWIGIKNKIDKHIKMKWMIWYHYCFYTSFEIRHKCLGNLNFLGVPLLREALSKNEKTHARIKCSTPEEPDYTTKGGNPGAFFFSCVISYQARIKRPLENFKSGINFTDSFNWVSHQ